MNRTDAATILSIDPSASPEEAKRAYQDLFTEHQVRLTNAPTPALRSLYQARLLELDEARDAFLANSVSDADADLPTDQPSIPTYRTSQPPPPPPGSSGPAPRTPPPPPPQQQERVADAPPEPPPKTRPELERAATDDATVSKKPGKGKAIPIIAGVIVVAAAIAFLPNLFSKGKGAPVTADSTSSAPKKSFADSIPKLRESITVARVEFGRGDYDAANAALKDADAFFARVGSDAAGDTALTQIKSQIDSLHGRVTRACEALKKVAERHPGEPTCKSL